MYNHLQNDSVDNLKDINCHNSYLIIFELIKNIHISSQKGVDREKSLTYKKMEPLKISII